MFFSALTLMPLTHILKNTSPGLLVYPVLVTFGYTKAFGLFISYLKVKYHQFLSHVFGINENRTEWLCQSP